MSHSAEKCKRGDPLTLSTYILLENIKKLERGTLLIHLKVFEKKSNNTEKKLKGGPFSLVRFCRLR